MPTFAQWEAQRRGQTTAAPAGPDYNMEYDANHQPDPNGERLSFVDDPARYLGHMSKGLLHSPFDLVKGFLGIPGQVVKGLTQDLPTLVKDPSLLLETPGMLKDAAHFANTKPDEMGSLLGQMLLGPHVPGAVNTALAKGPSIVGKGVSAVGKGAEAAGTSRILKRAQALAPIEAATGHIGPAIASAVAPPVLEYGGKLLQRGGAALEGLDLAYKGKVPFAREAAPEVVDPADVMREKVAGAREDVGAGFSRKVASKLNGLKSSATDISHPTAEVAGAGDLFPYQKDAIDGLRGARNTQSLVDVPDIYDNPWENDLSAVKPTTLSDSPSFKGLQDSVRRSNQKPIENFYEDNPQARVGGEGRMTGQFEEGAGGLSDIASGNFTRNKVLSPTDARITSMDMPPDAGMPADFFDEGMRPLAETGRPTANPASTLDELSQLSGRQASPARMQQLLDRLGGRGAVR